MTRNIAPSRAKRLLEANFCSFETGAKQRPHICPEKRSTKRFHHEDPVVLETEDGELFGAVVMNYGQRGLYFESDLQVRQGVILRIRNESTLACDEEGGCCAEVRWSKRLERRTNEYHYGTGVCFC